MDIHILKEKINRRHQLLTRLQDEFVQDLKDLAQLMLQANQYLDTLAKVEENLSSKITETQADLERLTSQHKTSLSMKDTLESQLNQIDQEIDANNHKLATINAVDGSKTTHSL